MRLSRLKENVQENKTEKDVVEEREGKYKETERDIEHKQGSRITNKYSSLIKCTTEHSDYKRSALSLLSVQLRHKFLFFMRRFRLFHILKSQ